MDDCRICNGEVRKEPTDPNWISNEAKEVRKEILEWPDWMLEAFGRDPVTGEKLKVTFLVRGE